MPKPTPAHRLPECHPQAGRRNRRQPWLPGRWSGRRRRLHHPGHRTRRPTRLPLHRTPPHPLPRQLHRQPLRTELTLETGLEFSRTGEPNRVKRLKRPGLLPTGETVKSLPSDHPREPPSICGSISPALAPPVPGASRSHSSQGSGRILPAPPIQPPKKGFLLTESA